MNKNINKITKAVFPVAGMGTRFIPATKATPKEMMPVIDKPLIQYAVEEAVQAGITELIFITSGAKRSVEDHFDKNIELEIVLTHRGQYNLLEKINKILPPGVKCIYIRQDQPLGLGHAIRCASSVVGDQPFAVLLADDLIEYKIGEPSIKQLIEAYNNVKTTVIGVQEICVSESFKYGIVGVSENFSSIEKINGIIEKPLPKDSPSKFAAVGRYILTPDIFNELDKLTPNKNELQLTDAIHNLSMNKDAFAFKVSGKRYDCGSKLGYLQAIINFGLKNEDIGLEFRKYLKSMYPLE